MLSFRVFQHPSGREIVAIAASPILGVAIDRQGQTLITTGANGLQVWPIREIDGTVTIGPPQSCDDSPLGMDIDISADGRFVVAMTDSSDTSFGIVDVSTRKLLRTVPVIRSAVGPRFSPDGRWLAVGNWNGDGNAVIFDSTNWELSRTLVTSLSTTVQFSNDSQYLVSSDTKEIAMWRTRDWTKVASTPAPLQRCMVFSPDDQTLAAIPIGGDVRLLDAQTLKELIVLEAPDGSRPRYMAFSPDGNTLVVSTSNSRVVQKWNLRLIRDHLRSMDLDWHSPSSRTGDSIANTRSMQLHVDLGRPNIPH
jgi:WD40 repeat protein